MQKKYHTVYWTTNLINEKFYIGKHTTNDLNDDYYGSGKYLIDSFHKYGAENFVKVVLFICDTPKEAYDRERLLVSMFLSDRLCMNLQEGGKGGWDWINSQPISEETKLKISIANKGKKLPGEQKLQISQTLKERGMTGEKNPFYGRRHSEETKKIQSEVKTGKNNYWYGKHLSDKHKHLVSISKTKERHPQYGKKWMCNFSTQHSVCAAPDEFSKFLCRGYVFGRILKKSVKGISDT